MSTTPVIWKFKLIWQVLKFNELFGKQNFKIKTSNNTYCSFYVWRNIGQSEFMILMLLIMFQLASCLIVQCWWIWSFVNWNTIPFFSDWQCVYTYPRVYNQSLQFYPACHRDNYNATLVYISVRIILVFRNCLIEIRWDWVNYIRMT